MGQPTVAELDRQAFQALRMLHLKVFPLNQRTQGIFNEQDLRLKSLMKDLDCSDLAVREAWESFVSAIIQSRSQSRREGTPAARQSRRYRPYQTSADYLRPYSSDLLRILDSHEHPARRYPYPRHIDPPQDDSVRDLEILPLESPDSPWRTGWNWVHTTQTRSATPEDEPPRELTLASPRARSASPDASASAWLQEWEAANAARSRPAEVPPLRRRHRFHTHRPRSDATRSRTFDELHARYRSNEEDRFGREEYRRRERLSRRNGDGVGRDTRRDGVVFPDTWLETVDAWEEEGADLWAARASMIRSRPQLELPEAEGERERESTDSSARTPAREASSGARDTTAEGVGRSERLIPHVEVPGYERPPRRIAPLPRRARGVDREREAP